MSNLTRWTPMRDLVSMSEAMNRLFDEAFIMPRDGGMSMTSPKVDVVENADNIIVKAEMPGFDPNNVDCRVEGNMLMLRGEYKQENEKQEGQYHMRERRQGSFARSIPLPTEVDADKANAEFENGVLTLTLPKNEAAKPKRISINAKSVSNNGNKK
ncbi:MAG: Hsp20/alpha crystallin family protein [Anaerolineae bacterium]|nr:Hsp20/alpha crystallin family protein [Anaerolineae bacterium]